MKKITKAIIPAGGLGTRLLPITKTLPKELLPIINVPPLQFLIEEAIISGIKQILVIINRRKKAIIDYFKNTKLPNFWLKKDKQSTCEKIKQISQKIKIKFVYQKHPNGLGDAIKYAEKFVKNEPFAVLLGDDLINTTTSTVLKRCLDWYYQKKGIIVAVEKIKKIDTYKYGIISYSKKIKRNFFAINNLVEKPEPDKAPSDLAIVGRYVLTPHIFYALKQTKKDKCGEIQLTDALQLLLKEKKEKIFAYQFDGKRYDLGNKLGVVKTIIDFALADQEINKEVKKYIQGI